MAYDFVNHLITASIPSLSRPLTISCWFNANALAAGRRLFMVGVAGSQRSQISITNDGTAAFFEQGIGSATAISSNSYTATTWNHLCGVSTTTASRTVYLNGTGTTNTSTVSTQNAFTDVTIGFDFYSGKLAECGVWNVALTAEEVDSLAKGFQCDKIRPQSLVFYAPLIRNLQDIIGAQTMSNTGATVFPHPRVY